jgi:hypothetical protein
MNGWVIFGVIVWGLLVLVVELWTMNHIEIYTTKKSRRKYEEQQSARGLSRSEQGKVGADKDLGESSNQAVFQGQGGGSRCFDEQVSGSESSTDDGLDEELGQVATGGSSSGYGATSPYKPLTAYQASAGAPLRERLEALREVI